MIFIQVISAVYKFYKLYIVVQENLKFTAGPLKALKSNPLINRRKTI